MCTHIMLLTASSNKALCLACVDGELNPLHYKNKKLCWFNSVIFIRSYWLNTGVDGHALYA